MLFALILLALLSTAPAVLVPREDSVSLTPVSRLAPNALPVTAREGLNGDSCESSGECSGGRLCLVSYSAQTSIPYVCDSPDKDCMCLRGDYLARRCTKSDRCDVGERCFKEGDTATVGLCYSCAALKDKKDVTTVDDGNCKGEAVKKRSTTKPKDGGLNGDSCQSSKECAGGRLCLVTYSAETSIPYVCDSPEKECTCLRTDFLARRCTKSNRCDVGERCFQEGKNATVGLCFSCDALKGMSDVKNTDDGNCNGEALTASESSAQEDDDEDSPASGTGPASPAPCIGVDALEHLPRDALVFREHIMSDVLCDAAGSCATHGHVVVFRGSAMMMGTYCAQHAGRCASRRMLVNSPRMVQRAMRVASRTEGLEYTAFAARYRTAVEEHVLRTLVRVGL